MSADEVSHTSALAGRIAEGKADPITAEERALVAELRASYEKRFGLGLSHRADPSRMRFTSAEDETAHADADELIRLRQEMGS